eukprot:m.78019 g.78019  ORF g.78019 m.78019 type:complete len:339 (-) comp25069_c0_seq2:44-1060(-)
MRVTTRTPTLLVLGLVLSLNVGGVQSMLWKRAVANSLQGLNYNVRFLEGYGTHHGQATSLGNHVPRPTEVQLPPVTNKGTVPVILNEYSGTENQSCSVLHPDAKATLAVVVPIHLSHLNAAERLCRSLFVDQTNPPEFVVLVLGEVEDSKVDEVAKLYRNCTGVIVMTNEQLRPDQSRNIGMDLADTTLVSFLDADDLAHPNLYDSVRYFYGKSHAHLITHGWHNSACKNLQWKCLNKDMLLGSKITYLETDLPSPEFKEAWKDQGQSFYPKFAMSHVTVHPGGHALRFPNSALYKNKAQDWQFVRDFLRELNGTRSIYIHHFLSTKCYGQSTFGHKL